MLDWAGEVPANPGVTGNQNSNTPTCGLWCHTVRAELGEERIRGLRRPRPRRLQIGHVQYVLLQPTNVLRVRLVNVRMIIQPSAPDGGAAAVEICNRGKRQKTNKVECLWQKSHQSKMAAGL